MKLEDVLNKNPYGADLQSMTSQLSYVANFSIIAIGVSALGDTGMEWVDA